MRTVLVLLFVAIAPLSTFAQESATDLKFVTVAEKSDVSFELTSAESRVPKPFRLKPHTFPSEATFIRESGPVRIYKVTFPSPVKTETEINNTVHAEYYLPAGEGPFPAVVVLHILGGEFPLSQMTANSLARSKVAALFIKMPYYGERRQLGNPRRMLSKNLDETVEGFTQAVLDIRRGAAWLNARPEVDQTKLGITGISLGGITSALSASAEPRFRKVAIYLGGGNLAELIWERDHPEVNEYRRQWIADGGTKASFLKKMNVVDPAFYGKLCQDRDVLMVAAKHDEIIPAAATIALYESIGKKPNLVWLNAGHITAAKDIFGEMLRLQAFFNDGNWPALK